METATRRARLVARHHLRGTAPDALTATTDLVVLHATDPATVYLSILARCATATLADVDEALYDERSLLRMLAMRRTLFVAPRDFAPVVHHGAALEIGAQQRKRLLSQLRTLPTEPAVPADLEAWLESVETSVEATLDAAGVATAAELSTAEPRLRTSFLPTTDKKWDVKRNITSQVVVLMGAEGRMVRGKPRGSWTSRAHTWESPRLWWPDGIPDVPDAKARLVERYLRRFGPASETDVAWWTGWTLGATRKALAQLATVDVGCGLVLADDQEPQADSAPTVALLPALDPTPMGWKERDWFLPDDRTPLYDRNGNIGPTVWWGGEVVGGWAVRADGSVATHLLVDRGKAARTAVDAAAATLTSRLPGTPLTPSFPTPLEKHLRTSAQ